MRMLIVYNAVNVALREIIENGNEDNIIKLAKQYGSHEGITTKEIQ